VVKLLVWLRRCLGWLREDRGAEGPEYAVIVSTVVIGALVVAAIVTGVAQDFANSLRSLVPGAPQP
jgi:Flp pilus assembly pilin Flp